MLDRPGTRRHSSMRNDAVAQVPGVGARGELYRGGVVHELRRRKLVFHSHLSSVVAGQRRDMLGTGADAHSDSVPDTDRNPYTRAQADADRGMFGDSGEHDRAAAHAGGGRNACHIGIERAGIVHDRQKPQGKIR